MYVCIDEVNKHSAHVYACNGLRNLIKLDIQIRIIRRRSEGEDTFQNYNFPCSDEVRLINAEVQTIACVCSGEKDLTKLNL
jgi:hypothetical protein